MYDKDSLKTALNIKSLDLYNFAIKTNFKKRKTLKDREKYSLQNGVFSFLKFHFISKLYKTK